MAFARVTNSMNSNESDRYDQDSGRKMLPFQPNVVTTGILDLPSPLRDQLPEYHSELSKSSQGKLFLSKRSDALYTCFAECASVSCRNKPRPSSYSRSGVGTRQALEAHVAVQAALAARQKTYACSSCGGLIG
jgi:hypothetical protein